MPQLVGYALAFVVSNVAATFGASVAFQAIAAQFAASLGGIVFGLGLLYASNLLSGNRSSPGTTITPSSGQQAIRQDIPTRTASFGIIRKSGPVWWFGSNGDKFYLGLALNHGESDSFIEHFLDDAQVELDGNGFVTTAPYVVDGSPKVQIITRNGLDQETKYDEILNTFGVDDVRGDGVTTALIIYQSVASDTFRNLYPTGGPCTYRATLGTRRVWDPRNPAQSRTDKSTHTLSGNNALATLTYVLDPEGYNIPWDRIEPNISEWCAAADVCDVQRLKKDGTYGNNYELALTYSLDDDPKAVLAKLLSTFDGWLCQKLDGSIGIKAGIYELPEVVIDKKYILGMSLTCGSDPVTGIAGVRASFLSRTHDYRALEADPWPNGNAILNVGDDRAAKLDNSAVPDHAICRRLQKRAYMRATTPYRGTITTMLFGLKVYNKRFALFDLSLLGLGIMSFEVTKSVFDTATLQVTFDVINIDSSIDSWDPQTEEGEAPENAAAIESSSLEAPTNFAASATAPNATLSWDTEPSFSHEASYKRTSDSTWTTVPVTAGQDSAIITGLTSTVSYDFRVRSIGGTGTASPWSNTITDVA